MNAINPNETLETDLKIHFDMLCREFDGGSFYGLEYILDDFFQNETAKLAVPARPSIDWFGLYN